MSGFNDPFSVAGTDIPAANGGPSPDFWRNLMMFGGNMAAAANARTPQGFLQYGNGFAGPFGAALSQTAQSALDTPVLRSRLGLSHAQAEEIGLRNQMTRMQMPYAAFRANLFSDPQALQQLLNGGDNVPSMPVGPQGSNEAPQSSNVASVTSQDESGNNPSVVNKQGFIGKYQFGKPALMAAGVYQPAQGEDINAQQPGDWKGTFSVPGRQQPMTYADFLKDPGAQDAAFAAHAANLSKEIKSRGLDQYIGQTVGGVPITQDSLIEMMHGGGPTGTQQFLQTGGQYNPADANGKTIADFGRRMQPRIQVAQAGNGPVPIPGQQPNGASTLWQPQQANAPGQFSPGYISPEQAFQRAKAARRQAVNLQLLGFDATPATQQAQQWQDYGQKQLLQQTQPQTIRGPGSAAISPATGRILQSPLEYEITGPDMRKYRITQNAVETGQPYERPKDVPSWAPPGTLSIALAEPSPGEAEAAKEASQDAFGEKARSQYQSAAGTLRSMEDIEQQMEQLNAGSPNWYNTGAGAQFKLELGKTINSLGQSVGAPPIFDPAKLAAGEDIVKQSKLAGMQVLSTYFGGSREAASIVHSTQGAVPGIENTPLGGKLLLGGFKEGARWLMDQHSFMSNWYATHAGNMVGADVAFTQQYPPKQYTLRAISQVRPYEIAGDKQDELKRFLPGTRFIVKADPTHAVRVVPGDEQVMLQSPQQQPSLGSPTQ